MRGLTGFLALAGLVFSGCSTTGKRDATVKVAESCAHLTENLTYIHESLKQNFSGYADSASLREQGNAAFAAAQTEAAQCQTEVDYQRTLRRYLASYHDPHLRGAWTGFAKFADMIEGSSGKKLNPHYVPASFVATGVYVVRYGDGYFVKALDPEWTTEGQVRVGDELKSCAGRSPGAIINEQIMPFEPVSAKEAAAYRLTPWLFFRWDLLAGTALTCEFKGKGGNYTQTLAWHAVPEDYLEKKFQPRPSKIYELETRPYGHWVTIRGFAGYTEDVNQQLKVFADDAKRLRRDKVIVVDVRGNTGGNSQWGTRWIENLFGYANEPAQSHSLVLASPGNTGHFERLYAQLKKTNGLPDAESADYFQRLIAALHAHPGQLAAVGEGRKASREKTPTSFKGIVYVLTDYMVFSSGEIFVEQLKQMPRVTQVGIATNASTFYSDIRFDIAPSGLPFSFPTMVERDGFFQRGSGEALLPEMALTAEADLELAGQDSLRKQLEEIIHWR